MSACSRLRARGAKPQQWLASRSPQENLCDVVEEASAAESFGKHSIVDRNNLGAKSRWICFQVVRTAFSELLIPLQRENQPDDLLNERKIYLFGVGTDFRKLKYPFIWYDILHVTDVLSRLPFVHTDPRFQEMVETITAQANGEGRYTAGSMYRAWKGWSFADKKSPSPWLTFLVLRVIKRMCM